MIQTKPKINLVGRKYGRLLVVAQGADKISPKGKREVTWDCDCVCGNKTNVRASHLKSGHTISCGCAHKEQEEKWKEYNLSHGRNRKNKTSKSYKRWMQIKDRCYNPQNVSYAWYGGKGIEMWEGWLKDPGAFCLYVESLPGYEVPNSTIDRIDPSKNYEPGNLRWISLAKQQSNKSNNVLLTYKGKTQTASEWAKELGMCVSTITYRKRAGWSDETALTKPSNNRCAPTD